ncbi:MAG: type I restriction endonuclease subunit M [Polaromonas sp.]|uniref:type I restriction endonuclease subunit M n=1 Tax=Polaromonas sp. TaxID=1869339 RepID=UPI00273362A0|nr:type I restriction endonuclease subunit M [Polaromonas sp.]MDP3799213.1 type I restriction endonuclease subunit M [Polaromonas sp.]
MSAPFENSPKTPRQPLFLLGRIVATPGALHLLRQTATSPEVLLMRHVTGDWGEVCAEDAEENRLSLEQGFRLMSVYRLPLKDQAVAGEASSTLDSSAAADGDDDVVGQRIWLITEADRSCTTFLLPSEY